jgi:hypothetical protein
MDFETSFLNSIKQLVFLMETRRFVWGRKWIFKSHLNKLPITVAAWSKASTIFDRSNTGISGSNPTQDMDVCIVYVYSVCVVL